MKKIKKLNEISLLSIDDEKKIKGGIGGGCEYDDCGSGFKLDQNGGNTDDKDGEDGGGGGGKSCGCSGCMYTDGGPGFRTSMISSPFDGYDCNWYGVF